MFYIGINAFEFTNYKYLNKHRIYFLMPQISEAVDKCE